MCAHAHTHISDLGMLFKKVGGSLNIGNALYSELTMSSVELDAGS